ncbi:MAG: LysR family transcriptional regulator [Oscillospiraceae bacterium]|nr:LysR family transcriptional regulator [Oscillospiraceae bacterium]
MNFRLLKYFVAVASTLSFSRAADNLHISQSTLSQQIQQLEDYYGVKLFDRRGRSITLTAAGLELQKSASQLLVDETQLRERMQLAGRGVHRETWPLRIFFDAHMNTGPFLVGGMLDSILQLQEETASRVDFSPVFSSEDMDAPGIRLDDILADTKTDLWLIGAESELKHPGICFHTMFVDSFSLMISRRHPLYREGLTLTDIPDILNNTVLFLIQNRSRNLRTVLDVLPGGAEVDPAIRFEKSADAIGMYVALGQGVSVVPQGNKNENLSAQCVSIPLPNTHFYTMLGYRKENENPLVTRFTEIMLARFSLPFPS